MSFMVPIHCRQGNLYVETLDLGDNDMGPLGAMYIADTLRENNVIKHIVGCVCKKNTY